MNTITNTARYDGRDGQVVIGLFSRWRQFGRRYFWPHILLGMVAASLGLPASAQNTDQRSVAETPSSSLFIGRAVHFDHLIRLQDASRRTGFNVDYWHQHAIRTVIRNLSFTLVPQQHTERAEALPFVAQKQALIETLHALLTRRAQHFHTDINAPRTHVSPPIEVFNSAQWLASVRGIRAGPACIFS